jgi:ClpP class serine protease
MRQLQVQVQCEAMLLAAMQIARAVNTRSSKVTVPVPVYALSGGTHITLAAVEIVMDSFSVLGPIDPQIVGIPAASPIEVEHEKPIAEVADMTRMSERALEQLKRGTIERIGDKLLQERAKDFVDMLAGGQCTHGDGLNAKEAQSLGLSVKTGIPPSILDLMKLYPHRSGKCRRLNFFRMSLPEGVLVDKIGGGFHSATQGIWVLQASSR